MTRRFAVVALAQVVCASLLAQSSGAKSDPAMTKELDQFRVFIQQHPRALAELQKDPSLIRTAAFSEEHQAVREYLENHSAVKQELRKYPNFFDGLRPTTQGGQNKKGKKD
jgi:hypothetical protein